MEGKMEEENKTEIKDLVTGMSNVNTEGVITTIDNPRDVGKGREMWVANAILEDMTGKIKLTLWNKDIEKFKAEDKVKIINGYIAEFNKEKQLTAGKNGEIKLID